MRLRNAALLASKILAVYVGFHAVVYAGDVAHALIRHDPVAEVARSVVPLVAVLALATVLWVAAPWVAGRLAAGTTATPDGAGPATAAEIAAIAFAVAGLYIASQALPLIAHGLGRLATGTGSGRDVAADLASAVVRLGIGAGVGLGAGRLAARMVGPRPPR